MAAGKVAEEAVEVVADEVIEVAEAARRITSRDMGLVFFGSCVGTIGGFAIGYFWAKSVLTTKYEALADSEIAEMKEHYNAKHRALDSEREKLDKLRTLDVKKEKETLDTVVEDLKYRTDGEGRVPYHQMNDEDSSAPEAVTNVTNIFNQPQPEVEAEWDYAEETKTRNADIPYVIHKDEYTESVDGYEQHTLTYFEGDDVLSNERDQVIEDQDGTIGLGNLSKFGKGSGDPNIVYIRNESMKVDIEIVHSDGKFATEVHGFQNDELQHSSMRRRSPRRSEYDTSD